MFLYLTQFVVVYKILKQSQCAIKDGWVLKKIVASLVIFEDARSGRRRSFGFSGSPRNCISEMRSKLVRRSANPISAYFDLPTRNRSIFTDVLHSHFEAFFALTEVVFRSANLYL